MGSGLVSSSGAWLHLPAREDVLKSEGELDWSSSSHFWSQPCRLWALGSKRADGSALSLTASKIKRIYTVNDGVSMRNESVASPKKKKNPKKQDSCYSAPTALKTHVFIWKAEKTHRETENLTFSGSPHKCLRQLEVVPGQSKEPWIQSGSPNWVKRTQVIEPGLVAIQGVHQHSAGIGRGT